MMAQKGAQDSVKEEFSSKQHLQEEPKSEVSVLLLNNFYKYGAPTLKKGVHATLGKVDGTSIKFTS